MKGADHHLGDVILHLEGAQSRAAGTAQVMDHKRFQLGGGIGLAQNCEHLTVEPGLGLGE